MGAVGRRRRLLWDWAGYLAVLAVLIWCVSGFLQPGHASAMEAFVPATYIVNPGSSTSSFRGPGSGWVCDAISVYTVGGTGSLEVGLYDDVMASYFPVAFQATPATGALTFNPFYVDGANDQSVFIMRGAGTGTIQVTVLGHIPSHDQGTWDQMEALTEAVEVSCWLIFRLGIVLICVLALVVVLVVLAVAS